MSSLEEHDAEQAAITAACEAETRDFEFQIACDIRAYGYVTITAPDFEQAKAKLTAEYVAEHFCPHGGADNLDCHTPCDIWSECATATDTGEDIPVEMNVAPGTWDPAHERNR